MKERIQGVVALLVATIIWGTAFVAQSVGMDHVGPFTIPGGKMYPGGNEPGRDRRGLPGEELLQSSH